jgi:carbonic anhydrase
MKQDSPQQRIFRRKLLQFSAGLIGTSTLTTWFGKKALADTIPNQVAETPKHEHTHPKTNLTPDQALAELIEGNKRFLDKKILNGHHDLSRLAEVAQDQAPFAAILGCADSRVVPEITFDQGIGDIFVVRVAGNIAVTEDVASEEYAVAALGVPLIMVLGHQRCGAVKAALDAKNLPGVLTSLVDAIKPAIESSAKQPGDRLTNAVKANVKLQVKRLKKSSVIGPAIKEGKLKIVGAYYDLDTGKVSLLT